MLPRELAAKSFARLKQAFFAPTDAESLNLFRLLYCGSVAVTLTLESGQHYAAWRLLRDHPGAFHPIRLFALIGIGPLPPAAFTALRVALLIALGSAAVGLATRWALTASWIGFFLYYGTVYSVHKPPLSDKLGHKTDSVIFILWILCLAPQIGRWGADAWARRGRRPSPEENRVIPAWPLQTVKLMLVIAYFGAAYCKLSSSLLWADGRTMQAYMLESAMAGVGGLSLWLAQHLWLCAALSVVTLLFESSFAAVLFCPGLDWIYVAAGLSLHAGIQLAMDKPYFKYFILPYWAFLSWPLLLRFSAPLRNIAARKAAHVEPRRGAPPAAFAPARLLPAAIFILSLTGVEMAFIYEKAEAWPFSAWGFFASRKDFSQAVAYRLQGISRDGATRWLTREEGGNDLIVNDYAMRQFTETGDDRWLRNNLVFFIENMPRATARELKAVAIIKRTVRQAPGGRFEFVDLPLILLPVHGEPSGGMRVPAEH